MMKSMMQRRFTLIELLVVVSIIAVLASMLLPALGRARKQAKFTVCMGNTRTLMQATTMYALDNESWLPRRGDMLNLNFSFANVVGSRYLTEMKSYLPDSTTYYCPDGAIDKADKPLLLAVAGGTLEYAYYSDIKSTSSYTLSQAAGTMPTVPNRLTDDLDGFGNMSMIYSDVNRWSPAFGATPIHTNHPTRYNFDNPGSGGYTYHNGYPAGLNNGFIDGHSEWLKTRDLNLNRYFQAQGGSRNYHWR